MKLVQVAEANKKYYSKDFIHGFNTGAKTQLEADKKEAERLGSWIIDKEFSNIGACSICGDRWGSVDQMKYCPSCGARMEASE